MQENTSRGWQSEPGWDLSLDWGAGAGLEIWKISCWVSKDQQGCRENVWFNHENMIKNMVNNGWLYVILTTQEWWFSLEFGGHFMFFLAGISPVMGIYSGYHDDQYICFIGFLYGNLHSWPKQQESGKP